MSGPYLISSAYAKSGVAVYYSHLDTVRILERALRRTEIPVRFTQGCNPHIRLSTYWALPLGVATDREWFVFFLDEDVEPAEILKKFNDQLPEGFRIVDVHKGAPEIGIAAGFDLAVHHENSADEARSAVEDMMSQPVIEVVAQQKGRTVTKDVKPHLDSFEQGEDYLLFHLKAFNEAKPKASHVAKALHNQLLQRDIKVESIRMIRHDHDECTDPDACETEADPSGAREIETQASPQLED